MFIEILFKMLLFKGGVLIYAEHYIYTVMKSGIYDKNCCQNCTVKKYGSYVLEFMDLT